MTNWSIQGSACICLSIFTLTRRLFFYHVARRFLCKSIMYPSCIFFLYMDKTLFLFSLVYLCVKVLFNSILHALFRKPKISLNFFCVSISVIFHSLVLFFRRYTSIFFPLSQAFSSQEPKSIPSLLPFIPLLI